MSYHSIDLLLLDLNLHGKSGFLALENAVAGSFQTIIVSAYADQAITAYEYGVLDFVNKPFSRARLEKALNRFLNSDYIPVNQTRYLSIRKNAGIKPRRSR